MLRINSYIILNLKKKPIFTKRNKNWGSIINHLKTPIYKKCTIKGNDSPISDHKILKFDILEEKVFKETKKKEIDTIIPNTFKNWQKKI